MTCYCVLEIGGFILIEGSVYTVTCVYCDKAYSFTSISMIIKIQSGMHNSEYKPCDLLTDIDECKTRCNKAHQTCHNTPGSYYCPCDSGYYLHPLSEECVGMSMSNATYTCINYHISCYIYNICFFPGMLSLIVLMYYTLNVTSLLYKNIIE